MKVERLYLRRFVCENEIMNPFLIGIDETRVHRRQGYNSLSTNKLIVNKQESTNLVRQRIEIQHRLLSLT